jgi:hypothetical protein
MAADSDGNDLTAVVICEGDFHDPTFPQKLNNLVARLNSLIEEQPKSKRLKVNKVSCDVDNRSMINWILIDFLSPPPHARISTPG